MDGTHPWASLIKVIEPYRVDQLIRGLPLLLCSHTGGTPPIMMQSKWSMLYNKSMMHFGPWEENPSLFHTMLHQRFQCACTHAETNTAIGLKVSLFFWSYLWHQHYCSLHLTICLLAGGMLRFGSRCVLYVVSCVESFHHWITWLVKHLSEWCCIIQVY